MRWKKTDRLVILSWRLREKTSDWLRNVCKYTWCLQTQTCRQQWAAASFMERGGKSFTFYRSLVLLHLCPHNPRQKLNFARIEFEWKEVIIAIKTNFKVWNCSYRMDFTTYKKKLTKMCMHLVPSVQNTYVKWGFELIMG